ncbi:hypothetical protein D043_2982B, partial [Vibrio parahaemolyticus EKP-021]
DATPTKQHHAKKSGFEKESR